jgi:hypothetical protein
MLASGSDQVWLVLWLRFSFDYTRRAKHMKEHMLRSMVCHLKSKCSF